MIRDIVDSLGNHARTHTKDRLVLVGTACDVFHHGGKSKMFRAFRGGCKAERLVVNRLGIVVRVDENVKSILDFGFDREYLGDRIHEDVVDGLLDGLVAALVIYTRDEDIRLDRVGRKSHRQLVIARENKEKLEARIVVPSRVKIDRLYSDSGGTGMRAVVPTSTAGNRRGAFLWRHLRILCNGIVVWAHNL